MKIQTQQGFSLIELITVMLLIGILAAIVSSLMREAFSSTFTEQSLDVLNEQARISFDRMGREIRGMNLILTTSSSQQLTFINQDGVTVSFSQTGQQLMLTKTTSQPLSDYLISTNGLTFAYYDKQGTVLPPPIQSTQVNFIQITLQLGYTSLDSHYYQQTYQTLFYLRNQA